MPFQLSERVVTRFKNLTHHSAAQPPHGKGKIGDWVGGDSTFDCTKTAWKMWLDEAKYLLAFWKLKQCLFEIDDVFQSIFIKTTIYQSYKFSSG